MLWVNGAVCIHFDRNDAPACTVGQEFLTLCMQDRKMNVLELMSDRKPPGVIFGKGKLGDVCGRGRDFGLKWGKTAIVARCAQRPRRIE